MITKIGIVSDTHGILRPEVLEALEGVELILHAGDILGMDFIRQLQEIAPVYAVRGNCDQGEWSKQLPKTEMIEVGKATFYMLHNIHELDIVPSTAGVNIIVSGHSHQPICEKRGGILFLNPGSCGPRRFSLPIAMAVMELKEENCIVQAIDLENPNKTKTFHMSLS